jgi:hypothetical protein
MEQQQSEGKDRAAHEPEEQKTGDAVGQEQTTDDQENKLEAEQESAAAMDADVPQPPGADQTTEGQPS